MRSKLKDYLAKRHLAVSKEPSVGKAIPASHLQFVVQKHAASHLHYDFRIEVDGVLKSWAVPKGPSLNPRDKRLAIMVEDHPLDYRHFEGVIPQGYGAGAVMIWDRGTYSVDDQEGYSAQKAIKAGLKKGVIHFSLKGEKLKGDFSLVRLKNRDNAWLLVKQADPFACAKDVLSQDRSVVSHKNLAEIEGGKVGKKRREKRPPLKPMLATLIEAPFDDKDWLFEIKWDGFRALADVQGATVNLLSRNLLSFNTRFAGIVKDLKALRLDAILDGELVALDEVGLSHFQLLQNVSSEDNIYYYIFDILYLDGKDLRSLPLEERKAILKSALEEKGHVRYLDHVEARGKDFFRNCKKQGCEGVIGKNKHSPYRIGERSKEWVKIKAHRQQEVIICGFTEPKRSRKNFGALVVGVFRAGRLVFAGHVGGGFSQDKLEEVKAILNPLVTKKCPFHVVPKTNTPVTWVKPRLLCEVRFSEWTKEGSMRHPIFLALRSDKSACSVVQEKEIPVQEINTKNSSIEKYDFLSHLSKLYWPEEKITKGALLAYYEAIASYILPYLKGRPQVLKRFPHGITKPAFFQKNLTSYPEWVSTVAVTHKAKTVNYLVIDDTKSLLYAVNLGCIELHTWLSRYQTLDHPDFLVLDLDPVDIAFSATVEVAQLLHMLLEEMHITNFCKTSGGRGLHIVIPLQARYSYEQAKQFAQLIATMALNLRPDIISLERSPKNRRNKVYIDCLQNNFGQTLIAPYSVRARPGAPVSYPLYWEEINNKLRPENYTLFNTLAKVKEEGDPFKPILRKGVDLLKVLKNLRQ